MYPLRFPLSRAVGALGIPLSIKIEVGFDKEAQVFIASSPDVPGLVAEAESLDALRAEMLTLVPELLEANCGMRIARHQDVVVKEQMHLCAA